MSGRAEGSRTLEELQAAVRAFRDQRDWAQFHTLKDLAAAVAIEAGELQQELLWVPVEEEEARLAARREEIEAELADVVILVLSFAEVARVDLGAAIDRKLAVNAERYPADVVRGSSIKFDERRSEGGP